MTKITRQTQKIFANAASNNGVIGSGQDGTKVLTNNLATLQSKGAWNTGWLTMVLGTKKFPPLEEFQALDYINTYQLSYLFQEGVPEYDSGTTYFTNSWVKKAGTNQIYGSLTDTNVGNALTDATKWKLLVDFDATVVGTDIYNYAVDTGTANHFIIAPSPAVPNMNAGNTIFIKPLHDNTGACDVSPNSVATAAVKLASGANPSAGMMITTGIYCLVSDGTHWILVNPTYDFGTAAFIDVGTAANQIPQLDSSGRLPAIPGQLLTGILAGTLGSFSGLINFENLGTTLQWGYYNGGSANPTVTFPTPFSAPPAVFLQIAYPIQSGWAVTITGLPTDNDFKAHAFGTSSEGTVISSFFWAAIGAT